MSLSKEDTRPDPFAGQLADALMRLQDMHPDITVLQARTFLLVAANPGTTQKALLRALSASDSTVSRAMAVLSNLPPKPNRMGGMGLVEFIPNVLDRREKFMHLSPKGLRVWRAIAHDLGRK
jgi:DNA-binding MarR family transcriptional regulator